MRAHWNKIDLACIIVIVASYYVLSVSGLNWDHLELAGGYGLDPDGGGISEALGYLYNLQENWSIGYKDYPQGYGLLLALFNGLAVSVASLAGKLPTFELHMTTQPYSRLLMPVADISSAEGRIFFTLVARGMSALFGFLTVVLVYFIGRDYFCSRRVGFIASIFLLSTYPFVQLSLIAKYPATTTFFFLLSFYLSCRLLQNPSPRLYLYSGLSVGFVIATSYLSGLVLLVLLLAHAVIMKAEGTLAFVKIWFDKRILSAAFMVVVGFLLFNPRVFAHAPILVLDFMAWLRQMQPTDQRADLWLPIRYAGMGGSVLHLRDEIGLPLLFSMLAGLAHATAKYSHRIAPFLLVGFSHLIIYPFYQASYFISTAYPVLLLLAAGGLVSGVDGWNGFPLEIYVRTLFRSKHFTPLHGGAAITSLAPVHAALVNLLVLGLIVTSISAPGAARIVAQNLINEEMSTSIQARQWILRTLPVNSKYLVDAGGIQISDAVAHTFHASYQGGSRMTAHSLQDIIHTNGVEVFSAAYAVSGSDLTLLLSDENISKYPALKRNLSPADIGFGLREAFAEYTNLLSKNAVLLKEFPAGRWIGVERKNSFGYQFEGLTWAHAYEFLTDASSRTHGPPIKIYQLTPEFWWAVEAALFTEKPAAVCNESNSSGAAHSGTRMIEQTAVYESNTKTFAIEFCWQSDHKKVMNEVVFSLDYASMLKRDFWYYIKRGISTVLGTNQRHRQIYREYFNLQGDSYRATTTFSVPDNMVKGDYVLRYYFSDDPYNEIELARITQ